MDNRFARIGTLLLALFIVPEGSFAQSDLDQTKVYQAQSRLFEGNFLTQLPDGKIGPRTIEALKAWQKKAKRPQTGILTEDEFQRLMRFDPGKHVWEAIAGSVDGTWAAVWKYSSGVEAVKKVLGDCRRKSVLPGECSYISHSIDSSGPGWSAAVYCKQQGFLRYKRQMFLHNGLSRQAAVDQAFAAAAAADFKSSECSLVKALDGNGPQ